MSTSARVAEAPEHYLTPAGWQSPQRLLTHKSFAVYAASIQSEVRKYRVPFYDGDKAEKEVSTASPLEISRDASCKSNQTGIAILIHGLSDTAFAMRDMAQVLAEACYTSRTVLLPDHGTRAGDLLTTRRHHWHDTLRYLIQQASAESEHILLVGFSLGAVLALDQAITEPESIDGIIALSPAYHISSYSRARWSPWVHRLIPWVDRGIADDAMRYEAMPMRGVAETVKAIQALQKKLRQHGAIDTPWLLAQSLDDQVVVPEKNQQMWSQHANHPNSRLIQFYNQEEPAPTDRTISIKGTDDAFNVLGLTHLAIHISPDNEHYGHEGAFRNCGLTAPRDRARVRQCEQADQVLYGLWGSDNETEKPLAMSTFNPAFDQFAKEIRDFALKIREPGTTKK